MVKNYDYMLSRFRLISERHGRTDRRTELLYQYRAADFDLDERHVIKNEKVALDRLRVR